MTRDELPGDAWIDHDPHWLSEAEADELMAGLLEEESWEQRPIVVFGKEILQPRLIAWGGELPYKYSGQVLEPRPLSARLAALNERVAEACGVPFNHVLLNRYRNGLDSMGWHADDERELGRQPVIGAISLGAVRRFALHRKRNKKQKRNYDLEHGSLLVMGGACQHTWRHAVPKTSKPLAERINLTFRWLKGPPGWREPFPTDRRGEARP